MCTQKPTNGDLNLLHATKKQKYWEKTKNGVSAIGTCNGDVDGQMGMKFGQKRQLMCCIEP